jgi:hypothetical protein
VDYADFNDLANGLSSIATIVALAIGAIWTYQRFVRTREANPRIEFTVDIAFVTIQNGHWVAEAIAFLQNKGLVRHDITIFSFEVRYLLGGDPVEAKNGFLVYIPNQGSEGSWLPKGWGNTFIEPGLMTRYSALIRIPSDATAVLIHGRFLYADNDWHTADKLVAVPISAQQVAPADVPASGAPPTWEGRGQV